MTDVTRILGRIAAGDPAATDELIPIVYDELRRLAARHIGRESPAAELEPTALVHEAWLRLAGSADGPWENRAHFFGAAAEAMRRILIDRARSRKRIRHGGDVRVFYLDSRDALDERRAEELFDLDEALKLLESRDPQKAQLVKLKFFVGLTTAGAADVLGIPLRTAERAWAYARAWLYRQIAENAGENPVDHPRRDAGKDAGKDAGNRPDRT
jgi:RNA polymerase sigma factor (TIGR02999 family)